MTRYELAGRLSEMAYHCQGLARCAQDAAQQVLLQQGTVTEDDIKGWIKRLHDAEEAMRGLVE